MRGPTSDESSAYLTGGIEFTTSKRPSSSDGIPWSAICRSLRFEQGQTRSAQSAAHAATWRRSDSLSACGDGMPAAFHTGPRLSVKARRRCRPRHIHRETFAKRPGVEFEGVVVVIVEVDGLSLALDT